MKRYQFEVCEEVITPIEVVAETEQDAREVVFEQSKYVTLFEATRGEVRLVLRSVIDD